jgi:hypothetical protein
MRNLYLGVKNSWQPKEILVTTVVGNVRTN